MPKTKEFVSSDSEASDASSEVGQQHESNIIKVTHVIRISMLFLQFVGILHCVQYISESYLHHIIETQSLH